MLAILCLAAAELPSDIGGWVAGLSALTSTGFAVWYGYYTQTVTMPALTKEHREQLDAAIQRFDVSLRELRNEHKDELDTFWRELKEERTTRQQDTLRVCEAIQRMASAGRPVV